MVTLLKNIPGHPDNIQTLEVWAALFGINEPNKNKKSAAVAELLAAMYRELELIREQMQKANFSESLYSSSVTRIEDALSTMLLPATWNQVRQYLTPETFVALSFCGEILPDEETQIEPAELTEIHALIDELQVSLSDSQLPPRLNKLVEHHIDLIRRALAEYPISGAKTLREAARTALGELIEEKEIVATNREAPEINKLGSVWKKVNEAADTALKAEKLSQLGQKAWAMLENVF
ncbi:hypothetical protein [Ferribacterium limneticum]|uniref:hypothetical protein n=1 Tax=Ferribacterium limneticum TaxID=76259 RepID=UPI001CFBD2E7|nr:hypothetical protein [Ferribacterium limneticum]UCV19451.1 hypothetical protein KI610_02380 [Ferribacterium limneticum]